MKIESESKNNDKGSEKIKKPRVLPVEWSVYDGDGVVCITREYPVSAETVVCDNRVVVR